MAQMSRVNIHGAQYHPPHASVLPPFRMTVHTPAGYRNQYDQFDVREQGKVLVVTGMENTGSAHKKHSLTHHQTNLEFMDLVRLEYEVEKHGYDTFYLDTLVHVPIPLLTDESVPTQVAPMWCIPCRLLSGTISSVRWKPKHALTRTVDRRSSMFCANRIRVICHLRMCYSSLQHGVW